MKKGMCLKQLTEVDWSIPPDLQDYKYIGLGFLFRITEAVEAMAKNHNELIKSKEQYREWWIEEKERRHKLQRKISGLKGYITKLKKGQ